MAETKKGQQKGQRLFERIERRAGQHVTEKGDEMDRASGELMETAHAA